jgi:hypothetical protein
MGKKKKQKWLSWIKWPKFSKKHTKESKKKNNKINWVKDPLIPEKIKMINNAGKTVVGQIYKNGSVEYFQIDMR